MLSDLACDDGKYTWYKAYLNIIYLNLLCVIIQKNSCNITSTYTYSIKCSYHIVPISQS